MGGDAVKLAKMKEICSWYANLKEMVKGAKVVTRRATLAELRQMFPADGGLTIHIELLLWAMDEAESEDPEQRSELRPHEIMTRNGFLCLCVYDMSSTCSYVLPNL